MKIILISAILCFISIDGISFQGYVSKEDVTFDTIKNLQEMRSKMKIRDIVILAKYAQGAVVFNSFFGYLKFMKQAERKIFLSQIVELTGHFLLDDSAAESAIRQSGLSSTCTACLILKEGVYETQLQKLADLPESEQESTFKLLLTLFSMGYQDAYQKHKNSPTKFWYWDYSEVENAYKVLELDDNQSLQLDEVLRP